MVSRFEKFVIDITEIDLYWHRIASSEMKRFGLKGNYAIYFTKLHEASDGLTSAELASACGKDKADVSRDIAALEKQGLVERKTVGDHNYRAKIILTGKGNQITEEISKIAQHAVESVGASYSDEERDCFYRVLDAVTENLRILSKTGVQRK